MQPFNVIAVDPGVTGAIAHYMSAPNADGGLRYTLVVHDVPTTERVISGKVRKVVDVKGLEALIYDLVASEGATEAIIEKVSGLPGQSASSGFQFGRVVGLIEMALAAAGVKYEEMTPAQWKKAINITSDKKNAVAHFKATFPAEMHSQIQRPSPKGKSNADSHDRAEAALLAFYLATRG